MQTFYADLHVHVGRSPWGGPVKISAAKTLTVESALVESHDRKGINLLGIVDAQTRGGLAEIEALLARGILREQAGGGFVYNLGTCQPLTLIAGAEIETVERVEGGGGPAHFLIFVPTMAELQALADWYRTHVTNADLSSQRAQAQAADLQQLTHRLDGLFIPAHVFTPFKSLYGRCAQSWQQLLPAPPDAIELGLSADRVMAAAIPELADLPQLTNSDAHSLGRIAREYTAFRLTAPTFAELRRALTGDGPQGVSANYGLEPRLGKYYRGHCRRCGETVSTPPPVVQCPNCGAAGRGFVPGVLDRIQLLATAAAKDSEDRVPDPAAPRTEADDDRAQPPYVHQVPLEFVPGLGPRTRAALLAAFGTEMAVLHSATAADLTTVVGEKLARQIILARDGTLPLTSGGGGRYGRVQSQ